MELRILWMYHDLMDLYGDKGNIEVLRVRCEKRGITPIIDTCSINQEIDITNYDVFFFGGGADKEQNLIFADLITRKDNILQALENGTAFLLICGGYQLFGKYYKDQDGNVIDGLNIFPYYTIAKDRASRCIGNIAIEVEMDGDTFKAVGFENHGGQTMEVAHPFGKVLSGHGNMFKSEYEGYLDDQVLATYMHGPLLPKNPKIADKIILRGLKKRYGDVTLAPLDDTLENKAQEVMLKRLKCL